MKAKLKTWKEATKPFRDAAKKSDFSNEDLKRLLQKTKIVIV